MTSNVTPFPTGKRVTSENIGIGGGLYYRLESIARRIHFLLEVAKQQHSPEPGKTYRLVRKRTVKRCFLAIAQKSQESAKRINILRKDGGYETAMNIFLELLQEKKGLNEIAIDDLRGVTLSSTIDKKDFEVIVDLLTGFNLMPSQILLAISGCTGKEIKQYPDDIYSLLKKISKSSIQ